MSKNPKNESLKIFTTNNKICKYNVWMTQYKKVNFRLSNAQLNKLN